VTAFDANAAVYDFLRGKELPASYGGTKDSAGNVVRARITFDELDAGGLGPVLRTDFYRKAAPLRYVRIDLGRAAVAWQTFLRAKRAEPSMPLTERMPAQGAAAGLWGLFVQQACPMEALGLVRPEDHWRPFLRQCYGTVVALNRAWGTAFADWSDARFPWAALQYDSFLQDRPGLRWRYLTHNFRTTFGFIAVHGSALRVTLIFILLTIAAALTVNRSRPTRCRASASRRLTTSWSSCSPPWPFPGKC